MGAGKGKDYGNTKNKVSKFAENLANLIEDYVLDGLGFFGEKANDTVRRISSSDPLATMQDFVKKATEGAEIKELSNGKGYIAKFSDGFQIIYREKSSSDGSPALEIWTNIKSRNASSTVEIEISGQKFKIRYQKIHFVEDKKE